MTAHKWADEIKAWALDRDCIEQCCANRGKQLGDEWHRFNGAWTETPNWVYRIKPISDQVIDAEIYCSRGFLEMRVWTSDCNIRLVVDGENLLKSVRMIGKPDPNRMEALLRVVLDEDISLDTRAEIKEALRTD